MKIRMVGTLMVIVAGLRPGLAAPARTLPPQVYGQMHAGRKLARVWVSPGFDPARGFRVGQVGSTVTSLYGPAAVEALPSSLARLAEPASTNVLDLTITELHTRERVVKNFSSVTLGVEGLIRAADGTPLAAFATRLEANGAPSLADNCKDAADRVAAALAEELGRRLKRPSEVPSEPKPAKQKAARTLLPTPGLAAPQPGAAPAPAAPAATAPATATATTHAPATAAPAASPTAPGTGAAPAPAGTSATPAVPLPVPEPEPAEDPDDSSDTPAHAPTPEEKIPRSRGQHY